MSASECRQCGVLLIAGDIGWCLKCRRKQARESTMTATCVRCQQQCSHRTESGLCRMCCRLPWEPTPAEIEAAWREIRATWSEREEMDRRAYRPDVETRYEPIHVEINE